MHKFITFLLILFVSLNLFSQDEYFKLPQAKTQKPFYIFNKKIIGNEYLAKSLKPTDDKLNEQVKNVSVLIDKQDRKQNPDYNLSEHGVLMVDLKNKIASKSQFELNEFFGLDKQSEIYIDGYLLEDKKFRIALNGITEIEIVEPDSVNGLKSRVLNIWTLAKRERYMENAN